MHRLLLAAVLGMSAVAAHAQTLTVHAAGSLRGALTELARAFEAQQPGTHVVLVFGASGLLKERLLAGEASDVFASANMAHPQALAAAGKADAVQRFTRNAMCVLAHPSVAPTSEGLAAALLHPALRVGTSTPGADPSGDYAFELFDRIERSGAGPAGSAAALKAKALQLTGGPQSPPPPAGRNVYGMLVAERQADLFVTYCTNATLALREQPSLKTVAVPAAWGVAADYGIAALRSGDAPREALGRRFVEFVLAPDAQALLARHGFALRTP
jgi:ABC-type molybdate transport system substrate-binding protein